MTTGGKFQDAVERLHQIMLSVTLLAVESRQEITEVCYSDGQEKLISIILDLTSTP